MYYFVRKKKIVELVSFLYNGEIYVLVWWWSIERGRTLY